MNELEDKIKLSIILVQYFVEYYRICFLYICTITLHIWVFFSCSNMGQLYQ